MVEQLPAGTNLSIWQIHLKDKDDFAILRSIFTIYQKLKKKKNRFRSNLVGFDCHDVYVRGIVDYMYTVTSW